LMAIIECNLELSLGSQGKTKSCYDFMAVFKARIDTINAHRGHATPTHSRILTLPRK